MKIGEVAAAAGVTAKTIRYYEQVGVLPAPARSASGYRDYTGDVLERLAFVRAAQAVGLTLAGIRGVIGVRDGGTLPCSHVLGLLRRKTDEIDAHIEALRRMRPDLTTLIGDAAAFDPQECSSDHEVCWIIARAERPSARQRR